MPDLRFVECPRAGGMPILSGLKNEHWAVASKLADTLHHLHFVPLGKRLEDSLRTIEAPEVIHVRDEVGILAGNAGEVMAAMSGILLGGFGDGEVDGERALKSGRLEVVVVFRQLFAT
jgi:hypothetical protein